MEKVAVEIWSMGSDAGYVPSTGWADVHLVPAHEVAASADCNTALFNLAQQYSAVTYDQVIESEPVEWRTGVCNYSGITGVLEVPDGMVAVQVEYLDISTRNGVSRRAKVLGGGLKKLFEKRAAKYAALAEEL